MLLMVITKSNKVLLIFISEAFRWRFEENEGCEDIEIPEEDTSNIG